MDRKNIQFNKETAAQISIYKLMLGKDSYLVILTSSCLQAQSQPTSQPFLQLDVTEVMSTTVEMIPKICTGMFARWQRQKARHCILGGKTSS